MRKDTNDLLSTCTWVEEVAGLSYNPILLFKPQGIDQSESMNDLAKDDFILALQTEFQRDVMMQYGSEVILKIQHMAPPSMTFNLYPYL